MVIIQVPCKYNPEMVKQITNKQTQISYDREQVSRVRQEFIQFMGTAEDIYAMNTYIGSQYAKRITNLHHYETVELSALLETESKEVIHAQLARVTLFCLINNLARRSGVSMESFEQLVDMFNNQVELLIPATNHNSQQFDATPNWHIIKSIKLSEYDAILITSQKSLSIATLMYNCQRAVKCIDSAILATAISFEANNGVIHAFTPLVNEVKQHIGQVEIAERLYQLLTEDDNISDLNESLKSVTNNILQDAYSLRCSPQVLGSCLDQIKMVSQYLDSAFDMKCHNLIFNEGGQLVDIQYSGQHNNESEIILLDYLAIAISEIGAIAERRIQRLMTPRLQKLGNYYHEFLSSVDNQYGLQKQCNLASNLIQKNKKYSSPTSCDSMPQTSFVEDINTNFELSIYNLDQIIMNTFLILAIDLYCSSRIIIELETKQNKLINGKIQKMIQQLVGKDNKIQQISQNLNELL